MKPPRIHPKSVRMKASLKWDLNRIAPEPKSRRDPRRLPSPMPKIRVERVGVDVDRQDRESYMLTTATSEVTNHVEPDGRMLWNDCSRRLYGCPRCAAMIEAKNHAGTKGGNSPKNVCIALGRAAFCQSHSQTPHCVESHTNMHLYSHWICGRRLLLRLSNSRSQMASLSSHRPR